MLKHSLVAGVCLAFAISSPAMAADPSPAAYAFKIGKLDAVALHDTQFVLPNDGKEFGLGAGPEAVAQVLKPAGAPTDKITLSVDALLVKTDNQVVLIDTGVGGMLQASLTKSGYKADAITDILITHAHPDHIGGLLTPDGQLAFPKAVIHLAAAEWAWLQSQSQQAKLVAAISGQVKTFTPGDKVAPGISSVNIPGHTPGHVGYEIVSGKASLLDIGDTAHSSIISLAKPEWLMGFDTDQPAARDTRVAELTKLAKAKTLIFSPHFPYPGVGYIVATGDHFTWKPASPAK